MRRTLLFLCQKARGESPRPLLRSHSGQRNALFILSCSEPREARCGSFSLKAEIRLLMKDSSGVETMQCREVL